MASLLDLLPQAKWDIEFFADRFLGIKLHPDQIRFAEAVIARNQTGWRAAYLTICCSAGNRAGKTLIMAIVILHSCIFKTNMRPPDFTSEASVRQWLRAIYDWYHFGIQQEVAELVYIELVKIFESRHEAQKGADCPMAVEFGDSFATWDKKERGEYVWITLSEVLGGASIHFRSTTEKTIGQLGKSMHGVSMDECGFETRLPFIINEVFQFRRLSTGGQLFLISTPSEGFTDFADEWEKGNPDNPVRKASHMSLKMSTRSNIGYGIDQDLFDSLVAGMPPELVPQNIDGEFLQGTKAFFNAAAVKAAFDPELPERTIAKKRHRYRHGIDPAATYDNTFSVVLDATDRSKIIGVSIRRLTGRQPTINVIGMAHDQHASYSVNGATCETAVDVTGYGGKLIREALGGIPGLRGVEFGGTPRNKFKLLMDVKGLIEQGKIKFPAYGPWLDLRKQLLAYRLSDRKLEQDAVMALAIAVKLVLRLPEGDATPALDFDYFTPEAQSPPTSEEAFWRNLRRRGTVQRMSVN